MRQNMVFAFLILTFFFFTSLSPAPFTCKKKPNNTSVESLLQSDCVLQNSCVEFKWQYLKDRALRN